MRAISHLRQTTMTDYDPNEPENLSNLLGAYVNVYWNDYLRYWELYENIEDGELTEEQRAIHRGLDKIGNAVRSTIHSLAPDPAAVDAVEHFFKVLGATNTTDLNNAAKVLRAMHKVPIVRDCVAINLAFEVADVLLPAAEKRAAELVALIASRRLSDRALAYLDRATRLHLWGFDPECAIMCRSVLEAALVARLSDVLELDEPPPPLEQLLALAGQHKLLPGYERAATKRGWRARKGSLLADADKIRWVGNHLIHDLPQLAVGSSDPGDSASAVRRLARVLDHLFPTEEAT